MFLVISRSVSSVQTPSVPPKPEVFGDQKLYLLEKQKTNKISLSGYLL